MVHSRPELAGPRQHPSSINIRPSCANNDTLSHVHGSKSCLPNSFLLFQSKQIHTGVENSHFNSVGTRLPDRQVLCPRRVLEASQAGREGAGSSWTVLTGDPAANSAGKPSTLPREEKQPRVEFLSIWIRAASGAPTGPLEYGHGRALLVRLLGDQRENTHNVPWEQRKLSGGQEPGKHRYGWPEAT